MSPSGGGGLPPGGGGGVLPPGGPALRDAAARGDVITITSLLANTPTIVNDADENGCTALQRAAADGHGEVVKILLQYGADPNKQDNLHGNTALHEAAWKGYSRCAQLLAAKATLHLKNSGGFAPLHLACQNGHNQTCREILLAGCDPDIQNNYGDTSLHTSARYGHAGVTRILISAECHVSDQNKNGDTPLHIAAAMGRRKLTRILIEAGCDKGLRNKQSETAKDIAIRKDLNEIIEILSLSSTKLQKEARKRDKSRRDKSVERTLDDRDTPDNKSGSKKSKERQNSETPTKAKDKTKKTKNVHFENNVRHWSPYGCHYYPDPKNFPKPNLDSLPPEPLKKGEQYYLDLAGNICKGPVGVGYTCYCAPFFQHMEDKLNRDKQELKHHIDKAHQKLDQKVTKLELKTQGQISELTKCVAAERMLCRERQQHLEQWLTRGMIFRASERTKKLDFGPKDSIDIAPLKRTKSLEILNATSKTWDIIQSFNDKIDQSENSLRRNNRKNSKSAEILDTDFRNESLIFNPHFSKGSKSSDQLDSSFLSDRSKKHVSSKSSLKSISLRSKTSERTQKSPSQKVTADIHVRSKYDSGSHPHSETDEKHSITSRKSVRSLTSHGNISNQSSSTQHHIPMNDSIYKSKNEINDNISIVSQKGMHCLDGIESDGYIKISKHSNRCDASSNELCFSDYGNDDKSLKQEGIELNDETGVNEDDQSRKSVQELVARIQEQQILDELSKLSTATMREAKANGRILNCPLSPKVLPTISETSLSSTVWNGNTIPLNENTHFNTIEPLNKQVQSPLKTPPAKASKKFSFHNLIPFPTRKMFNFQQKNDGNKSESSDEEDEPIRSTLEPGLMQNSNLLTTLPLPNYENMLTGQNAQPQMPNKVNGPSMNSFNPLHLRTNLLPIPKDAYFHEIPNKQRSPDHPFAGNGPSNRLSMQYPPPNHVHSHFVNPRNVIMKPEYAVNGGRSRNPMYSSNGLLTEMMHDHIDRELSKTTQFTNKLDQNAELEISQINNSIYNYHNQHRIIDNPEPACRSSNSNNTQIIGGIQPPNYPITIPGHPINMHLQNNAHHIQNSMPNLAINTQLTELQSQLDRDSHNDSGYSTKVYGSSQGASPSLSGNVDCVDSVINNKMGIAMNRNVRNTINHPMHSHLEASSLV